MVHGICFDSCLKTSRAFTASQLGKICTAIAMALSSVRFVNYDWMHQCGYGRFLVALWKPFKKNWESPGCTCPAAVAPVTKAPGTPPQGEPKFSSNTLEFQGSQVEVLQQFHVFFFLIEVFTELNINYTISTVAPGYFNMNFNLFDIVPSFYFHGAAGCHLRFQSQPSAEMHATVPISQRDYFRLSAGSCSTVLVTLFSR